MGRPSPECRSRLTFDRSPVRKSRTPGSARGAGGNSCPYRDTGLKPVIRRVWARRGQRPLALGHHRFQWLYVFGFVRPATGEVVWFLADAVNTAMFSEILAAFAREVGAGPDNLVVLVLDGAGWHVATDLVVPEGIHLEFLPPYSPELQPAEHLWPLINEPLANRHFTTLADLDQALGERCCDLADDDDRIRSSTQFHWWPAFI